MRKPIRLMTVNLLNGRADPEHLARLLERLQPDVIVGQELGPDAAEVIADHFPHHDLHPALDHRGMGIAGVLATTFGPLPLPLRSGRWARVGVGDEVLVVATVHLINPIDFPWWRSVRGRTDQLDSLDAWVDDNVGEASFVLAGDLNASPRWPAYRRLAERWEDLAVQAAQSAGTRPELTWGWRPGWPRMLRIDHAFGSGVRGVGTTVEPVRGSDHAALVVDLVISRNDSG